MFQKIPRSGGLTSDGLNQAQLEAYTVYFVSVSPTMIYSDGKISGQHAKSRLGRQGECGGTRRWGMANGNIGRKSVMHSTHAS